MGAPLLGVLALAASLWGLPAQAQEDARDKAGKPGSELESIERQLQADQEEADKLAREAEALRAEMTGLRSQLVAAAGRAQDLEEELSLLEQTLAVLEVEEARAQVRLQENRRQMGDILSGLQRLSLVPRESLILAPGSPIDIARGGLVLQAAYPKIESQASVLRKDLEDLASLRDSILDQRENLQAAETALAREREDLAGLLTRKETLEAEASEALKAARERAGMLSRQAEDLRDLVQRLEEERRLSQVLLPGLKPERPGAGEPEAETPQTAEADAQTAETAPASASGTAAAPSSPQVATLSPPSPTAPADIRPFPEAQASLVLPARGRITRRYEDAVSSDSGILTKGITIEARSAAQIVAPFDGKVVYARPFRGYGLILIIEHQGKYHSLLSGLERIDAVEGQWVLAGEPVGVLGSPTSEKPELYLELRRDGQPIDPLPWLASTNGKVKS